MKQPLCAAAVLVVFGLGVLAGRLFFSRLPATKPDSCVIPQSRAVSFGPATAPHYDPASKPPATGGRRIYVSLKGSDDNDGLYSSAPFRTLQRAAEEAEPGDVVLVRGGTYQSAPGDDQSILSITGSGTDKDWITYMPFPGERVRLKVSRAPAISIFGANYIRISGFELEGGASEVTLTQARAIAKDNQTATTENAGVRIYPDGRSDSPVHHVWLDHLDIRHFSSGGIEVNSGDYLTLEDNTVVENAYWNSMGESGIAIYEPQDFDRDQSHYRIVIRRNIVAGNENKLPSRFVTPPAITDGHGLVIDDGYHSHPDPGRSAEPYSGRILVADNLAYANGGAGFSSYRSGNVDFVANTSYRNLQTKSIYASASEMMAECSDGVNFFDNVIVAREGRAPNWNYKEDWNIAYDYNLYFGGEPARVLGPHDLTADPQFRNPGAFDFHLRGASPAIGSGLEIFPRDRDAAGMARPTGAGVDRGAFAFFPAGS